MGQSKERADTLAALVGVTLLVGGCARLGGILPFQQAAGPATPMIGQLEAVHAAAVAKGEAVFWVSSNGCTDKDDLSPVVRRTGGEAATLTLRRVNADTCLQPLPEGVELRWSFQELGLTPDTRLTIENPYQPPPGGV